MVKKRIEAEVAFKAMDSNLKDTVKGITSEITRNKAELKLEQAQLQLTGSESEKLESKLSSLEKQYDLQGQKIDATSQRLSNAKKFYGENSAESQKLERVLIDQQTAQQRLANDIDKTSQALSIAKGDTQTYTGTMRELDGEQRKLQASANLVESEYKKWQATTGQTASESEKFAKAQEYVAKQSSLAEQKISIMRQQLDATKNEFGSTSTEAMQMQAKLNDAEREFEELGNAAKSVDTTNLNDIGSKIDIGNISEASDVISDIGDKMLDLGKGAMESADNVGSAQSKIQASFGLTKKEAQGLTDVAKNIYYKGFGESLDQTADAVVSVKRNLGELNNQDLQNITEQAMALDGTLGSDMDETLRGVNSLMEQYGMSAQDAMDLLVVGTQRGLDKTHELGDNMSEYTTQFKDSGYSAQEMFAVLEAGLDAGAYNLDKVNDLVGEFGHRMADGSIDNAVKDMGGNFQSLWKEIKDGSKTPKEAFGLLAGEISKMGSDTEKASAISAIFGSTGEDSGLKVVEAMGKATTSTGELGKAYAETGGAAQKMNDDSTTPMQELNGKVAELKDSLVPIGTKIIEAMKPVIEFISKIAQGFATLPEPVQQLILVIGGLFAVFAALSPVITAVFTIFSTVGLAALGPIIAVITGVILVVTAAIEIFKNWGAITDWLSEKWTAFKEWITALWTGISQSAGQIWQGITTAISNTWNMLKSTASNVWNGIKGTLSNIWQTIVNTGKSIWNSLSSFLSGLWNSLKSTASSVFNGLAQVVSNIWNGIKTTASSIWNGIKSTISGVANGIKSTVTNVFNGLKSSVSNIFNGIKSAMTGPVEAAKNTISGIIERIKGFFSGIRLRLPRIDMPPLPHFKLSGSFSLKPPSVPKLSVDWYKKGSVFNGPNVIGVGEAGPEAVLPLNDSVLGSIGRMIAERMPEGGNGSGQVVQNEFNIEINGNVDSEVTARRMVDDIMERITEKYSNQNSAFS
ncbi:phage tail tape measure protein [Enterococcus avium]|uniref:phage tail tape measure protein n=1 Tax=Enterococcus avium TaxID=33945 RepID=UPI00339A3230